MTKQGTKSQKSVNYKSLETDNGVSQTGLIQHLYTGQDEAIPPLDRMREQFESKYKKNEPKVDQDTKKYL